MNTASKQIKSYDSIGKVTSLEKMVSEELLCIGASYKYVGTYYLRDAIVFATKEKPAQYQTVRELIGRINAMVANKYGVKRGTVITQMAFSIERAFLYGNIDYLLDMFKSSYDYSKGKVDNITFILTVAEKIKHDMAEKQHLNATQLRILIQGEVENITDVITLGNLYGIVHALEGGNMA